MLVTVAHSVCDSASWVAPMVRGCPEAQCPQHSSPQNLCSPIHSHRVGLLKEVTDTSSVYLFTPSLSSGSELVPQLGEGAPGITGRPTGHIHRPTVTSAKMRGAALSPSLALACAGLAFVLTQAPMFPGNLFAPFCLLACLSKHRIKSLSMNCTRAPRAHFCNSCRNWKLCIHSQAHLRPWEPAHLHRWVGCHWRHTGAGPALLIIHKV